MECELLRNNDLSGFVCLSSNQDWLERTSSDERHRDSVVGHDRRAPIRYMKRVIDYVVAERSHFIFDSDRSYPMGVINPRPPLFSWSLALGGLGLNWLTDHLRTRWSGGAYLPCQQFTAP